MLVKPTMESLLKKVESRYTLSILAAKRARQLVNGALPLSTSDTPNFVTLACEEIVKGRIVCIKGVKDIYIPLRPEIAAERLASRAAMENARLQEALEETFSRTRRIDIDEDELMDGLDEDLGEETLDETQEETTEESSDETLEEIADVEDIDTLIDKFIPSEEDIVLDILEDEDTDIDRKDAPEEEK